MKKLILSILMLALLISCESDSLDDFNHQNYSNNILSISKAQDTYNTLLNESKPTDDNILTLMSIFSPDWDSYHVDSFNSEKEVYTTVRLESTKISNNSRLIFIRFSNEINIYLEIDNSYLKNPNITYINLNNKSLIFFESIDQVNFKKLVDDYNHSKIYDCQDPDRDRFLSYNYCRLADESNNSSDPTGESDVETGEISGGGYSGSGIPNPTYNNSDDEDMSSNTSTRQSRVIPNQPTR